MKKSLALAATLLLINSHQVLAGSVRTVYSQDVDSNLLELKICQGYGLTINLMSTGEVIKQVWIGDPSRFAFTSNGNLCPKRGNEPDCAVGKATVLFLRQINPIKFPALTYSKDGSTQITVLTNQKQYQFKLTPATGEPSYTSLVIKPDSDKPEALLVANPPANPKTRQQKQPSEPQPLAVVYNNNSKLTPGMILQRNDANALAYGLTIANRQGLVLVGSTTWNKAQDAIRLLRQGKSREEAISGSGVDTKVFYQLIEWGNN
ncbi:hypothetical protein LC613_39455 [Nostoc sphaeroides CHAB 2801]|uniref:hypothetical protein n=1 Tax=Nostoc sphaeroides TaxID=446679 RepID=UPI001E5285A9|nr:hypothetical protein [Nostoc sphaeroides]MCC5633538.1 hypothetical protein [Nostoc sphaeroides CHAB 2801]